MGLITSIWRNTLFWIAWSFPCTEIKNLSSQALHFFPCCWISEHSILHYIYNLVFDLINWRNQVYFLFIYTNLTALQFLVSHFFLLFLFFRKGLRHHLRASEVPHQPPRELRHLQTHTRGWPVDPVPVLQWLVRENLQQAEPRFHPHRRGRATSTLYGRVQRHLAAHRRKCGLLYTWGTSQCIQLRQQPSTSGRHAIQISLMHLELAVSANIIVSISFAHFVCV